MFVFQDIEDIEAWLVPLGYIAFWQAIASYCVFSMEECDHCDGLIMSGKVPSETILTGLKHMAWDALKSRFGLRYRCQNRPWDESLGTIH